MQHNVRDSKGRFTTNPQVVASKSEVKRQTALRRNTTQKVNYVAIAIDRSGSMQGIRKEVVEAYNNQIKTLREESAKYGIKTYLTLITFSYGVDKPLYNARPIDSVPLLNINEYVPAGSTALRDAIGVATDTIQSFNPINVDASYLVVVITDGAENNSLKFTPNALRALIARNTNTDRWTYVALCPQWSKNDLRVLGIPEGNIQAWEATSFGAQAMSQTYGTATQGYYNTLSRGQTMTANYFAPDLSGVTGTKLAQELQDESQNFLRLNVTAADRIDEFVERTTGNAYVLGSGLYQLTKQENVQDYKKIVVQNKVTNKLYSGVADVRNLLKLPASGTIKLRPTAHPEYIIFVQSTAPNRKVLTNTTLLLDKSMI